MRTNQKGFTLIEVIIVILLVGILSAVALPRFVDLTDEAMVSAIEQTAGAMKSTSGVFYSQALTEGVDNGRIAIDGNMVDIRGGYLRGNWNRAWRYAFDISQVISFTRPAAECTANDLCGVGNQRSAPGLPFSTGGVQGIVIVWPKGMRINQLCYAYYFNPETGDAPTIGSITSGC